MSQTLIAVRLDTPLDEVQRTLEDRQISAVVVLDGTGSLCGILSSKDLLHAARLETASSEELASRASAQRTAGSLMRTAVITVDDKTSIAKAAEEMLRHRVHRLVVVRHGRPWGVFSTRDVMRAIATSDIATTLAEVMNTDVVTIDLGTPIDTATARLDDANVRGLVVVDGTWPVGVFTHTEAIRARTLPASLRNNPVERVMSAETICLHTGTTIDRVAKLACQMRARRILAVDHGQLKGIATGFDLLRVIAA